MIPVLKNYDYSQQLKACSLPNNVVLSESLNVFKSRLDKFLQNQDVVYDYRGLSRNRKPQLNHIN